MLTGSKMKRSAVGKVNLGCCSSHDSPAAVEDGDGGAAGIQEQVWR